MNKEPIMIDNVSNFCLVCYYDNKNKELVRIEQYKDGSGDIQTDIESHKYGYNAKIIKPEELIKQLARKTQECEEYKKQLMQKDEINTFFNTPIEGWSSNPCDICVCKNDYDHYRKALEKIEQELKEDIYCESQECGCDDFEECLKCLKEHILDIINKAKDGK